MLMRRWGPLLAVAAAVILAGIAWTFSSTRQAQRDAAPKPPEPISTALNAAASNWEWAYSDKGRPVVEIKAASFTQVKQPPSIELTGVELKIFHTSKSGTTTFDRVTSGQARFTPAEGKLYSEGEVEIELGIPEDASPPAKLLKIKSSGVSFDSKTGKAETQRRATFTLNVGEGEAEGASYDPQLRELNLNRKVHLIWRGANPKAAPMRIEAGELLYRENDQQVFLKPTARFTRGGLTMNGGATTVFVDNGEIRLVETAAASGVDQQASRKVEFGADQLRLLFRERGEMDNVQGQGNARVASYSDISRTLVRSRVLDLKFAAGDKGDSVLTQATANGSATAESHPVERKGVPTPDTRIVKADVLEVKMKTGGREIDRLVTHSPGTLDFLPNRPGLRKRHLEAERMAMSYGAENVIQSFRAVKVTTRTEGDARTQQPAQVTASENMAADFEPKTGDLTRIEQWDNFRYQQGERQAKAERAVLVQATNRMELTGAARIWDLTGSTDADRIQMEQNTGAMTATGNVRTVREAESRGGAPAPGGGDNRIRATAARMTTADRNLKIRYEGDAVLWQGESRLSGAWIDIDRRTRVLSAGGGIVNRIANQGQMTVVEAAAMRYLESDKVAFYEGKVLMTRPQLKVRSQRLRAYLSQASEETGATLPDSGIDRAFAEGAVEIVQTDGARGRTGIGETGDYYAGDNRVILEGAQAQLTETQPGLRPQVTRGRKLTWTGNADKLVVDGAESRPAVSSLRRKK